MTRNVFLGADLRPVLGRRASRGDRRRGRDLERGRAHGFAERAAPLAREIKRSKADLVGLQEVALWRKQTPSDGGAPPISPHADRHTATEVELDFLAVLRRQMKRAGAKYRVVVVQNEFDAELPVDEDGSDATGTGPLAALGADFDVKAHDARRDPGPEGEQGQARQDPQGPLHDPVRAQRRRPRDPRRSRLGLGRGQHRGTRQEGRRTSRFRFVDTHLEAFGDPAIREAQAKELTKGPLKIGGQIILVGDLNSGIARHNEPEQPGDDLAFLALAGFGMHDNGAVQSCCYDSLFDPARSSTTRSTTSSASRAEDVKASVTGNDPSRGPRRPWPSDHGGVVSTLRLRK